MKKYLKDLKKKKKGFTLIELIIVLAIIAIISAIAIPNFGKMQRNAKAKADIATAKNIATAVSAKVADGTITAPSTETPYLLNDANVATAVNDSLQNIPKPQLYGSSGSFYITIDSDGNVKVYSQSGTNAPTASNYTTAGKELYPTVDQNYK